MVCRVRQKVMGVGAEEPENVTIIIPVPVAQKLVDAKSDDQKQSAILEAQVFLKWTALFAVAARGRSFGSADLRGQELAFTLLGNRNLYQRGLFQTSAVAQHDDRIQAGRRIGCGADGHGSASRARGRHGGRVERYRDAMRYVDR